VVVDDDDVIAFLFSARSLRHWFTLALIDTRISFDADRKGEFVLSLSGDFGKSRVLLITIGDDDFTLFVSLVAFSASS
jgi:hypothetical protein